METDSQMQHVKKPYVSIKSNMTRYEQLNAILDEDYVREGKLRNLCSTGIPDHAGLRGTIWRLLLKYLPLDKSKWEQVLAAKRKNYSERCQKYFTTSGIQFNHSIDNEKNNKYNNAINELKIIDATAVMNETISSAYQQEYECDHPLSSYESSKWNDHSHSVTLMNEIEKDVCRTHPDINFYHEYQSFGIENQKKLQRILFLFAKSHPEISYVQGMNDICGTLLYVFGTDENDSMQQHAEEDAYYCFEYLINVHQDMYMKSQDSKATGIYGRMNAVMELLFIHDMELYTHLECLKLDISFFSVRWLTTLLTREFNLADTILIWDSLFADTNQTEFLTYFSFTMITTDREFLLRNDFAHNLFHLQHYSQATITTTATDSDAHLFGRSLSSSLSSSSASSSFQLSSSHNEHKYHENSPREVISSGTTGGENLQLLLKNSFDWRKNDFIVAIQTQEMISNNSDINVNDNNVFNMASYKTPNDSENRTQYGYLVGNDDFISRMMYLDSFENISSTNGSHTANENYVDSYSRSSKVAHAAINANDITNSEWNFSPSLSLITVDSVLLDVTKTAYNFIFSDVLNLKHNSTSDKMNLNTNSSNAAYEMNSTITPTDSSDNSDVTTQNNLLVSKSFIPRDNNNTNNEGNNHNNPVIPVDNNVQTMMSVPAAVQEVVVDFLNNADTQFRNFWRDIS